jgi:uncharacterized membrane protein YraQ (UPF0718 family)
VESVFAVVLGLLALGVGPLLAPLLRRSQGLAAAVDGFIACTVTGLVLLHVVPQSVALAGPAAIALAALGFFVPALLHRLDAWQVPATVAGARRVIASVVVLAGAFVHALLDGVALAGDSLHEHGHDHADEGLTLLALAVLLHRLPYSLAIWVVGRERVGTTQALLLLGALGAGTVVGALGGGMVLEGTSSQVLSLVQSFAAGAVLHVLLDAPAFDVDRSPRSSTVGVLVGLGVLVLVSRGHAAVRVATDELPFSRALLTLAAESAPAILLSLGFIGLLGALGPRLLRPIGAGDTRLAQAWSGVVAGAPLPVCSCTSLPIFESLVRRRVPVAGAVAFLIAAPELGLPSALVSAELLGVDMAIARLVGAVAVAVIVALVLSLVVPSSGGGPGTADLPELGVVDGFFMRTNHVMPWLVLGITVAACCEPLLAPSTLLAVPRAIEVPLYALLGLPLYLCSTGSTPLAALLMHKGASAGAAVALLLSGPAMNVATLGLLTRLWSVRAAVAFAAAVVVATSVVGAVVNVGVDLGIIAQPSLHSDAQHVHGVLEWGSLALLLALVLASLWRQGARRFLNQILHPLDEALGGHVHGPHCGHNAHKRPGFGTRPSVARVQLDFKPK